MRRAPQKHRSADERAELLAYFLYEQSKGRTAVDIAAEMKIPRRTLNRWKKEAGFYDAAPTNVRPSSSISSTIALLSGDRKHTSVSMQIQAVLHFIAWLRWPNNLEGQSIAIWSTLAAYASKKYSTSKLRDLPQDLQDTFIDVVDIGTIGRLCSTELVEMPSFYTYDIDEQPFTESDMLAETGRFLYWAASCSNDPHAVSLNKAYHVVNGPSYSYNGFSTLKKFRELWKIRGASTPFLFIENYHSSLSWSLDPAKSIFVDCIDELISKSAEVALFFRRSRHVADAFLPRLDPRAFPEVARNLFPKSLQSQIVPVPELDIEELDLFKAYRTY